MNRNVKITPLLHVFNYLIMSTGKGLWLLASKINGMVKWWKAFSKKACFLTLRKQAVQKSQVLLLSELGLQYHAVLCFLNAGVDN